MPHSSQEIFELKGAKILNENSPNAILIEIIGEEYWIPHSQIDKIERPNGGNDNVTIRMTAWIAKKRGLL